MLLVSSVSSSTCEDIKKTYDRLIPEETSEGMMATNRALLLNFDLGETADAIRETVHAFSQNEIAPRAAEIDRSNQFPRDLWPKIGALGLHGITVEEEYGGARLRYLEHCIAVEEISRASGRGRA